MITVAIQLKSSFDLTFAEIVGTIGWAFPSAVIERMIATLNNAVEVHCGMSFLEPSAGKGAIALWQRRRKEQGLPVVEEEDVLVFRKSEVSA